MNIDVESSPDHVFTTESSPSKFYIEHIVRSEGNMAKSLGLHSNEIYSDDEEVPTRSRARRESEYIPHLKADSINSDPNIRGITPQHARTTSMFTCSSGQRSHNTQLIIDRVAKIKKRPLSRETSILLTVMYSYKYIYVYIYI